MGSVSVSNVIRGTVCLLVVLGAACGDDGPGGPEPARSPSSTPIAAISFDALYVVNGGDQTVTVLDTEREVVAGTIALHDVTFPHHVYLSPNRARIAISDPASDLSGGHGGHRGTRASPEGAVLVLDALTGSTLVSRRLPRANHNAVFSPDGLEIWTSQSTSPGTVLVLDPQTLNETVTLEVGSGPGEVTFSSDGGRVFVANTGSDDVTVIDPVAKAAVATITVGDAPVGAWPGSNNVMYVDNEAEKTVTAIDAATLAILRVYHLGFTPGLAALGPDGNLWVTDSDRGYVALFAADADRKVAEIEAGSGAHAIAFNADGQTAYVSNQTGRSVSVIDVALRTERKEIAVGRKPNGLVWRAH